jgi:predicted nucleic acid-binding protein
VIVIDAGAALEWFMGTPRGLRIAKKLDSPGGIHATHLLDAEIAQALRRLLRSGDIYLSRAEQVLLSLVDSRIQRHSMVPLLPRIWHLRENLSAYDASYIALAEALDAPLLTCDGRLAAAPGHQAKVELF